ncbi:MAG: hypothetical protein JSU94_18915 [Phycisphaerales bacterium]|nr:MAG: hypothetical protein JSU94_18915 [Phycisphaerales bacterium]
MTRFGKLILHNAGMMFLATSLLIAVPAVVRSGGPYVLERAAISGGGTSTGGQYRLAGAIGQAIAGYGSGGNYELSGGFLPGRAVCTVEFKDFARFAELWLAGEAAADLNEDAAVNFADVRVLGDYWLQYCPQGWRLN